MIISARRVKTLREVRWCASCRTLLLTDCVSVYGSAGKPDKPYRIWLHESCASADVKAKLPQLQASPA